MFRCGMDGVISKLVFSALICHLAIVLHCSNAVSGFFVLVGCGMVAMGARDEICSKRDRTYPHSEREGKREGGRGRERPRGEQ